MVRTGAAYMRSISDAHAGNVEYEGTRITDLKDSHLAIQMQSVADRYYDVTSRDANLQFTDPQGNGPNSMAYMLPMSKEALHRKSDYYRAIARSYLGISGRMPDYMSAGISAWAAAADVFGEFGNNLRACYERIVRDDLYATHSTSVLRRMGPPIADTRIDVVEENSDGIVVAGARAMATSAPISDVLFVFPNRLIDATLPADKAVFFSVPTHAENLRFYCRCRFSGLSRLIDSLEETDALVEFDRVFVPWRDVYIYKNLDLFRSFNHKTGATHHFSVHTNARAIEKLDFLLSVLATAGELMGPSRNDHFNMLCGQVLRDRWALEAMQCQALENGALNDHGVYCPEPTSIGAAKVYFMEAYPRMVRALREHFSSEFFQLFSSESTSDRLLALLCDQWGMDPQSARKRLAVTQTLHDLLLSNMSTRSELYEMYYAGNPRSGHAYFWSTFGASVARDALER